MTLLTKFSHCLFYLFIKNTIKAKPLSHYSSTGGYLFYFAVFVYLLRAYFCCLSSNLVSEQNIFMNNARGRGEKSKVFRNEYLILIPFLFITIFMLSSLHRRQYLEQYKLYLKSLFKFQPNYSITSVIN